MQEVLSFAEEKMGKTVKALEKEFASIRAGRASPAVLNKIQVDYYGVPTPIEQMAAVSVVEARSLVIQPWDVSTVKAIEKAIQMSDIGINPINDGRTVRLNFPPLTEESKVAVRSIRRDAIEKIKAMKKNGDITEDDEKKGEGDIQKLTDKYVKIIDGVTADKEKETLEI